MIGVSLAYLPASSFGGAVDLFWRLQAEQGLEVCEVHLEGGQFAAAYCQPDASEQATMARLRKSVSHLGFHLPYLDLNPLSLNPDIANFAIREFCRGIDLAADAGADYLVFHARGDRLRQGESQSTPTWATVIEGLTDYAVKRNLVFCLENADDLRSVADMGRLADSVAGLKFCLDLGHLFERLRLPVGWQRIMARCSDRLLPWTARIGKGIPYYDAGGMQGCVQLLRKKLYCLHVHNHNGRLAHQALTAGKIDLRPMIGQVPASVPLILEADYRLSELDAVTADIRLLKGWRR